MLYAISRLTDKGDYLGLAFPDVISSVDIVSEAKDVTGWNRLTKCRWKESWNGFRNMAESKFWLEGCSKGLFGNIFGVHGNVSLRCRHAAPGSELDGEIEWKTLLEAVICHSQCLSLAKRKRKDT